MVIRRFEHRSLPFSHSCYQCSFMFSQLGKWKCNMQPYHEQICLSPLNKQIEECVCNPTFRGNRERLCLLLGQDLRSSYHSGRFGKILVCISIRVSPCHPVSIHHMIVHATLSGFDSSTACITIALVIPGQRGIPRWHFPPIIFVRL